MWNDLSVKQKAELIKIYLQNGITSLSDMKAHYNEYSIGGHLYYDGGDEGEVTNTDPTENYKPVEAGRLGDGYWVNLPENASVEDLRFTLPAVTIRPEIDPQYFINKNNEPFSTYNNYFNNSTLNDKAPSDYEKQIANSLISTAEKQALLDNGYTLLPDNRIRKSTGEKPLENSNIDIDLMTLGSGKVVSGLARAGEKFAETAIGKAITKELNNPYVNGALSSYFISDALTNNDPNYGIGERAADVALNLTGLPAVMNKGYNTFKTITNPIWDNYNFIKHINTQAGRYGYPAIKVFPNILSTKKTNKTVQNLVNRHNTFVRGVRTITSDRKLAMLSQEMKKFGYKNPTEKEMLEFMATTMAGDTGHGRLGAEDIAIALGIPEEKLLTNYSSNSYRTAYGYATPNDRSEHLGEKEGLIVSVRRPTNFGSDRYNWFRDNDFELLPEDILLKREFPTHRYYGFDIPKYGKNALYRPSPYYITDPKMIKKWYEDKKRILKKIQDIKQKPGLDLPNMDRLSNIIKHVHLDPYTSNNRYSVSKDQLFWTDWFDTDYSPYLFLNDKIPIVNNKVQKILNHYDRLKEKSLIRKMPTLDLSTFKMPALFTTEARIESGPSKGYMHYIFADPENKKVYNIEKIQNPQKFDKKYKHLRGARWHSGNPDNPFSLKQPGLAYGGPLQLMSYDPKTGTFTPNTPL